VNIFHLTPEERKELSIDSLPGSLMEAISEMEKDELVKSVLGDHIFTKYIEAKTKEWDRYRTAVTEWEISEYLAKF
jgi:glutamine synthetase